MNEFSSDMGLLSELKSKFEHPAQHIERVRSTNEMLLQRDLRATEGTLSEVFKDADREEYLLIIATHRYLTINGLLPDDYPLEGFILDAGLVNQHLLDRGVQKEVIQLLELFVKILVDSISASFEVLVTIIDEKSSKTPDRTVESLVMYKHYVSSAERIGSRISYDPEMADVRLVAAILIHGLRMMYRIKRRLVPVWTISEKYEEVCETYPLVSGSDLYWDLLRVSILDENYRSILELGQKTIDERLAVLEREKKAGRVTSFRPVRPSGADDISMAGETILYEIFRRDGDLTSERASKLERMFDSSLRQAANKKFGKQDIPDSDLLIDMAADIFAEMIYQFEVLAAGIISPVEFDKFRQDPRSYVRTNRAQIPMLTKKKLLASVGGAATTGSLARAFVSMVRKATSLDLSRSQMF